MPETCASCKFTIKTPKPVAKNEWKSIPCEMCHRVENGVLTAQGRLPEHSHLAVRDRRPIPTRHVATNRELCEKCHSGQRRILLQGGHGQRPAQQLRLHQVPQSTWHQRQAARRRAATPMRSSRPQPIAGHDAAHAAVTCVACHDASGLQGGPDRRQEELDDVRASRRRAARPGRRPMFRTTCSARWTAHVATSPRTPGASAKASRPQ